VISHQFEARAVQAAQYIKYKVLSVEGELCYGHNFDLSILLRLVVRLDKIKANQDVDLLSSTTVQVRRCRFVVFNYK
jgi:hypothetical protein